MLPLLACACYARPCCGMRTSNILSPLAWLDGSSALEDPKLVQVGYTKIAHCRFAMFPCKLLRGVKQVKQVDPGNLLNLYMILLYSAPEHRKHIHSTPATICQMRDARLQTSQHCGDPRVAASSCTCSWDIVETLSCMLGGNGELHDFSLKGPRP